MSNIIDVKQITTALRELTWAYRFKNTQSEYNQNMDKENHCWFKLHINTPR